MYASFDKVKADLGLTDKTKDTILAQMISDADAYLNSMLQIDSFDKQTFKEQIQVKYINKTTIYSKMYLKNFNVSSLTKVNGKAYTGILGTDYMIQHSRVIHMTDLYNYTLELKFPYFEIEYVGWFERWDWNTKEDELPAEIELMARLLVVGLYTEKYPVWYGATVNGVNGMWNITNYKLWDEQIQIGAKFGVNGSFVTFRDEASRSQFQQLFTKYKKAYVV